MSALVSKWGVTMLDAEPPLTKEELLDQPALLKQSADFLERYFGLLIVFGQTYELLEWGELNLRKVVWIVLGVFGLRPPSAVWSSWFPSSGSQSESESVLASSSSSSSSSALPSASAPASASTSTPSSSSSASSHPSLLLAVPTSQPSFPNSHHGSSLAAPFSAPSPSAPAFFSTVASSTPLAVSPTLTPIRIENEGIHHIEGSSIEGSESSTSTEPVEISSKEPIVAPSLLEIDSSGSRELPSPRRPPPEQGIETSPVELGSQGIEASTPSFENAQDLPLTTASFYNEFPISSSPLSSSEPLSRIPLAAPKPHIVDAASLWFARTKGLRNTVSSSRADDLTEATGPKASRHNRSLGEKTSNIVEASNKSSLTPIPPVKTSLSASQNPRFVDAAAPWFARVKGLRPTHPSPLAAIDTNPGEPGPSSPNLDEPLNTVETSNRSSSTLVPPINASLPASQKPRFVDAAAPWFARVKGLRPTLPSRAAIVTKADGPGPSHEILDMMSNTIEPSDISTFSFPLGVHGPKSILGPSELSSSAPGLVSSAAAYQDPSNLDLTFEGSRKRKLDDTSTPSVPMPSGSSVSPNDTLVAPPPLPLLPSSSATSNPKPAKRQKQPPPLYSEGQPPANPTSPHTALTWYVHRLAVRDSSLVPMPPRTARNTDPDTMEWVDYLWGSATQFSWVSASRDRFRAKT